jgi:acyl-CoA synthetase (AMP-forming)/AMP-acid ligase II
MGIYDIVRPYADEEAGRIALISEVDGVHTFGQLIGRSEQVGYALEHGLGLEVGDRVCLWLTNRIEWFEAFIGAESVGVATVQANPDWADREMAFVLDHSRSRAVICEATHAGRAVALRKRVGPLEHVLVVGGDETPSGARGYETLVAESPTEARGRLRRVPSDFAATLMYTSGTTTGRPKAVAMKASEQGRQVDYVEMLGVSRRDRAMFVTPLFHGNAVGAWQSALAYGGSAVFQQRFSARTFWDLVDRYRPTYLFTLAPIVNILMGRPPSAVERAHNFRVLVVLGSGPSAPAIEQRFGAPVIDWYGMTEAGSGTYTRLGDERRPGSAGRPFPNSAMEVVREDLTVAPAREVGEVAFRLDGISFDGYVDDPEASAAAIQGDFFLTGDLGYFDEDRYFYFVDRKKDIVRRGGENVSTVEVESVLRRHPAVADIAIVAKPDPVLGEVIVAFVVAGEDAKPLTADDLRQFGSDKLAAFKLPDDVLMVDELPRTATGKVEKFRLRRDFFGQ